MSGWRRRRCHKCGMVASAKRFRLVSPYGAYWNTAEAHKAERECPGCGRVAVTSAFTMVSDPDEPLPPRRVTPATPKVYESKATAATSRNIWDRIAGFCARCKEPVYHEECTLVSGARVHIGACPQ